MTASAACDRDALRDIARRAMLERGLVPDFPPAVLAETRAAKAAAPHDPSIRDLRGLLWASIDNDDSRDLDQLTVAETLPSGVVRVSIAVADVDADVPAGSATDAHAAENTTSVYTAGAVFSMLPERLSTDLTSLGEDADRLALVVEADVDAEGAIVASSVTRALVRNRAKLAYNSVAAWLDGVGPAPARVASVPGMDAVLRLQNRVAQAMKGRRHRQGALTLYSLEAHAVFQGDSVADLRLDESNRARELIEDFMIAANGVAARTLDAAGRPSLRRVLRVPERWDRIVELARRAGGSLPAAPDATALERFLTERRAADPERFPDLSLSVIKLLGRGEYAALHAGQRPEGHFGLAVSDYAHSTAPNRRYPDLVTQRLLKAVIAGRPSPYSVEELEALARHCSGREDDATKVERRVRKSAAALLMRSRIGERFDGIVTGATSKGTWVRLARPPVEGRLVEGHAAVDVGDHVAVTLVRVDVERGFIDFARTGAGGDAARTGANGNPARKHEGR